MESRVDALKLRRNLHAFEHERVHGRGGRDEKTQTHKCTKQTICTAKLSDHDPNTPGAGVRIDMGAE